MRVSFVRFFPVWDGVNRPESYPSNAGNRAAMASVCDRDRMERLEIRQDTLMIPMRETPVVPYLTLEDHELLAQCHVDRYRSHGPGGQKRNKTSSAVRLRHRLTGLAVKAAEDRSQQVNLLCSARRSGLSLPSRSVNLARS